MTQTLTLSQLQSILENHTQILVKKFTAILEGNNERMSEYVQESIEAISALQVQHTHIQTSLHQSLEGLGDTIVKEVSDSLKAKFST